MFQEKYRVIPQIIRHVVIDPCIAGYSIEWSSLFSIKWCQTGCVLSPILFNVYFDDICQRLQYHDIGCHVGTKFTRALDYADDLTLLSPFLRGLQKAVGICNVLSKSIQ